MGPAEILDGRGIRSLVIGNALADEFAGFAAEKARVPTAIRTRVLCHERRAFLVRMRLVRAAMD
eukprot:2053393-Pyramimonas_sp.AAC.1